MVELQIKGEKQQGFESPRKRLIAVVEDDKVVIYGKNGPGTIEPLCTLIPGDESRVCDVLGPGISGRPPVLLDVVEDEFEKDFSEIYTQAIGLDWKDPEGLKLSFDEKGKLTSDKSYATEGIMLFHIGDVIDMSKKEDGTLWEIFLSAEFSQAMSVHLPSLHPTVEKRVAKDELVNIVTQILNKNMKSVKHGTDTTK